MKLTKSNLKQLIKEEVVADEALLDAIHGLSDRIEELDVSIDFLASAFVGVPATSIAATQRNVGRYAHIPQIRMGGDNMKEVKRVIKEEIKKMVIFEENGEPRSYYCRFCHSVYGDGDILIFANTSKINNVVGLS